MGAGPQVREHPPTCTPVAGRGGGVRVGQHSPPPPVKHSDFLIFSLSGFTCSEGSLAGDPGPGWEAGEGTEHTPLSALPVTTNNQK